MTTIPQNQLDLFVASSSDIATKEQQDLMSRCWFSLSTQKRIKPIFHEFGDNWVKITGDADYGIATMNDNDVLLFVVSHYMDALNRGVPAEKIGRRFQFTGYEFFSFIGKKKFSGKGYADLWKSLQRLHHTFVETNIRQDAGRRHHSFNWLSEIKQTTQGNKHRGFEIVIPEFIYDSVVGNMKNVLTLDDGYFSIRSSLERWLYLFARKSSGWNVNGWAEGLESVHLKSGSVGTFPEFRRAITKIINKGSILGYKVELLEMPRQQGISIRRDNELIELVSKGRHRRGAIKWRGISNE
jgi:plasmid replication initiation protein